MKRTILVTLMFCFLIFSEISIVSASSDLSISVMPKLETSTSMSGKMIIREANLRNVNVYLKGTNITQEVYAEVITTVFSELGYSVEQIRLIGYEELTRIITESVHIEVTEQYVRVATDGKTENLTKKECFEKILDVKQAEYVLNMDSNSMITNDTTIVNNLSSISNTSYHYDWSTDGYMKILTTALYLDPAIQGGIGYYTLSGSFTWLIIPNSRYKDAFSIATNNGKVAWQVGTNDMFSRMEYTQRTNNNGVITTQLFGPFVKTTQDRSFSLNSGVYYSWNLPINTYNWVSNTTTTVTSLSFYISAKARVSTYNESQEFNVFSVYQHAHPVINLGYSFGWTWGALYPGVGISLTSTLDKKEYDGMNLISYYTDGY